LYSDSDFLIALGANLPSGSGPPEAALRAALAALSEAGATGLQASRFFATPCFPPGAGPDYVNAAARLHHPGPADELLAVMHGIEARHGRQRTQRWGQRTLDLDLVAAGAAIRPDIETFRHWHDLPPEARLRRAPQELVLPHPRLQDRAFVLVPLAEVAPGWRHPVTGLTVRQMLARLPRAEIAAIRPLDATAG
jgi:2-amino-4-hydroxy-6-hydroxymethyldihydropteridine diphosphokinase